MKNRRKPKAGNNSIEHREKDSDRVGGNAMSVVVMPGEMQSPRNYKLASRGWGYCSTGRQ